MKLFFTRLLFFIGMAIPCSSVKAQVVTVTNPSFTTPALAATYTSLANAVNALNGITAISGVVTITLNPGNPQTAPAGGYVINFTSPTTGAKRVIITGSNNTILSNGSLVSGTLTDAFFKVVGVDFLTIQNFTMQENPANITTATATNDMTEWGVALLYASATNGAQNNTIQNNTITLNKSYSNTFGIYSNTRHTATTINITADVTSTAGANSNNNIYGNAISNVNMGIAFIGSGDAAFMDLGNDIGGASVATANTITNWGGLVAGSIYISNSASCYGILVNNQKNETVSFNTITSATVSGTSVVMRGIYKTYATVPTGTFTSSVTNNVIRINNNFSSGVGVLQGISSDGITTALNTATININDNRFQNISVLAATSSITIIGINNSSQCGVLNINNNIFRGNTSTATTGGFVAISNSGAVQTTVNINGNQIGDASGNAVTFSAATSGQIVGIECVNIAPAVSLSISNNNFQGFEQTVAGTGLHVYILFDHDANGPTTDNINGNTFTNLVANTTGNITFIWHLGVMALSAGATENCNNNSIVTGFSKPVGGGLVTLYFTQGGSSSGNFMIQTGNDFSNITLTGNTQMSGWQNVDGNIAGGPTKNISNNVFSNWTCGFGAVDVIQSDLSDNNTTISNNTISNISANAGISGIFIGKDSKGALQTCSGNIISGLSSTGGAIQGIDVGTQTTVITFNVNNNTISGLSSGGTVVTGINVPMTTTSNVFKNKIYDLSVNNVNGEVYGINIYSTSIGTYNLSNNYIGDLRANITNKNEAIFGINLASTGAGTAYNVFYNTVYINALAGGTNFGTLAIKVASGVIAANGSLNLRNNILVNTSLAKGTGLTVSYGRTGTALNNFSNSSNNNIFYAGTPSTKNLIFTNGINNDQTLAAYKTRVGPTRDAASFTELPPFLSTVGSSANFLHLDPFISTQAESGAVNIVSFTDDFDGNIRQGNAGYVGLGTAPDIGADEMNSLVNAVVVVTNYTLTTPNLTETYPSLASAVTALNSITTISGAVTITLMPGHPQTAPVGGYTINFTAPSTITNNVTITGSNNTITANSSLVAGSLTDAIFKVVGVDFLTIQNFVMQDNAANTTTAAASNNMTEWGVALLYRTTTNGSQNNTIQNNNISLNKTYSNTFGIYSNTRHTATVIGTVADVTSTAGANSNNNIYSNTISNVNMGIAFIGSGNAAFMDIGNDIGGASVTTANTITNWGGIAAASNYISNTGSCYGIFLNNQKSETASFNTITSATVSGTSVAMRGIFKTYGTVPTGTFTSSITNNVIRINHNFTSGVLDGIRSEGISTPLTTATININDNRFQTMSVLAASSSTDIIGISNTSQCGVLNISNNIFRGANSTATTGGFTAISNTGAVQTAVNINGNQVGDASGNAITFSTATSGILIGIECPTIAAGAALSISNNNFQGFVQSVAGSGAHTYITYSHAASTATTDNINGNTFTNLVANTSGSVIFITRSGAMASLAGATENCNNNSIVTAFSKPTQGGIVRLFLSNGGALSGNFMVQTGNNFSNITITGTTTMNGWENSDGTTGGGPTKTINNNVFSNWICGTGGVYVIQTDYSGNNSLISNNTISNISGSGSFIAGISISINSTGSVQTISNNNISGLISTGGGVVGISTSTPFLTTTNLNNNSISGLTGSGSSSGINFTSGTNANVFNNKIYDLSVNNAAATITGIIASSWNAGTSNIYNNFIGDLRADITNNQTAIIGLRIVGLGLAYTPNIYYNTININAQAGGTNFGTAALVVPTSSVANDGKLVLRNNILVNTSIANGTGVTVAYRRTGTALNNYDFSSNNNIFYAGTPSTKNLIFTNGTNNDQTLAAYKTRVGPTRDAASFTELPPFLSTVGSSPDFLHLDPNIGTQAESGAVNIATYTDDFDGDIRQGNAGYTGVGTAPDIGADEIANETNAPVITYTTISSPICIFSGMTISGVVIKDSSGVPLSGLLVPRIYFRKNAGAWFSAAGTNTGGTAKNSTWSFTINEASMGGVVVGDVVSYYIIAQDNMPAPNVGANTGTGLVAANVNTVTIAPTTPNTYTISGSLNGLYTVGVGGNFTTLTAAVAAYNSACSLAGPVIFELIDNLYTTPVSINNHIDASAVKTLTIRPSATATPLITAASASSIIRLNGAKHVIFDGRQAGTGSVKSMTISNTGTASTILFQNDAQNSTIKFCIIKGQSTGSNGTIFFSGTGVAGGLGNDNNTIDKNDITDASSQPVYGIYSAGSTSRGNDNISITNNNISNYYHLNSSPAGIYINSNSSGWTITGNRLFQTDTRLYNGSGIGSGSFGIYINAGEAYTISNNIIGFANAAGTGSTNMIANSVLLPGFPAAYSFTGTKVDYQYIPIYASFTTGGIASAIDGNTISGISYLSGDRNNFFTGIYVANGSANIGSLAGNIIGSETGNNALYLVSSGVSRFSDGGRSRGIYARCSGTAAVQNNKIGGILISSTADTVSAQFDAIWIDGTANFTVSNNFIGNADANNLRLGYATSGGLLSNAGTLSLTTGLGAYGPVAFNSLAGIISTATGNSLNITGNTFRGLSTSNSFSYPIFGIYTEGNMTGLNPSVKISNNNFGTATSAWCDFIAGTFFVAAIKQLNNAVANVTISGNDFKGASTISNSRTYMIEQGGNAVANSNITINNNSLTDLSLQTNDLLFIYTYSDLTATSKRTIDSNRIIGNLSNTGNVTLIESGGSSVAGSQVSINNNNFSNLNAQNSAFGIVEYSGGIAANGFALKKINNNTLSNWVVNNGFSSYANGIQVANMGSLLLQSDSICNNIISNISTEEGVTGISSGYAFNSNSSSFFGNAASIIEISQNQLSGFTCNDNLFFGGTAGIYVDYSNLNSKTFVRNNTVSAINSIGNENINFGIVSGSAGNNIDISRNRIYDISGKGSDAQGTIVSGISTGFDPIFGIGAAKNVNIYNNLIGDLRATITGSTIFPAVVGINLVGGGDSLHVFNNTVNINSSNANGNAFFSTAALFTNTTANSFIRNNIFNNTSTPGTSGFTVSHWRSGTDLTTYSNLSNNNLLYAGTPTGRRFIYYNGTNTDQTLAAYKTRLGVVKESAAVTEQPSFLSTVGSNANFLHLDPAANCASLAKGDNSVHLLSSDFDNDVRMTLAPFIIDIGADETSKLNVWTGSSNTVWNNSSNWSTGIVPNNTDRTVYIPAAPANQPRIGVGETFQAKNVVIATGASLLNSGTLKVAGLISAAAASINNISAGVVTGSIEINRPCANAQVLAGNIFTSNAVKNFKINNDLTMSAVIGEGLNVSGEFGFDAAAVSKTFNSGNNLVLVSTANATANVSDLTNNSIVGQATVERFINTGTNTGEHTKTWQFLATPTTGQTIRQAWQENGTTPAGFGTIITGTGTGFDITTALPSLKFFNDVAVNWTAVTNTNTALLNKLGYMIFVRGDKSVNTSGGTPNNTVLRSKGTLFQPSNPPPSVAVAANKFQTFGNPYASRIEFSKVRAASTGINDVFYVWDPKLAGNSNVGGYQTITGVAGYVPTVGTPPTGNPATVYYPAGVPAPFIESGQAVFVKGNGTGGNVNFNETVKASGSRLVNRPGNGNNDLANRGFIFASLFTNTDNIADGNIVAFEEGLGNAVNENDALKMMNGGENFGIIRSDSLLAVEARDQVMKNDTIFYHLQNLKKLPYQFRFAPVNMRREGLNAYLIDRFNNSSTDVSLTDSSFINFSITTDVRSQAADRFILVFKKAKQGPKPTTPKEASEQSRGQNKEITQIKQEESSIAIYPNPVVDQQINIRFSNMAKGNYRMELSNKQGQVVYTGSKYIDQHNITHTINTNNVLASGSYQLSVVAEDGERMVENVVVK